MLKNNFGFGFLPVFLVFVALSVVSVAGWTVYNNQKQNNNDSGSAQGQSSVSPDEVTAKVQSSIETKYKVVSAEQSQPAAGEVSIKQYKESPRYKVKGYNFYNNYEGGSSLDIVTGPYDNNADLTQPSQADIDIRQMVAEVYKSFGLEKTSSYINYKNLITSATEEQNTKNIVDVYSNKNVVCSIEQFDATTRANTSSCGAIDQYRGTAETLKPIVEVIPNTDNDSYFSGLKISNSPVNGYQRATVVNGKINEPTIGLFAELYKKGSGPWVFFKETNMALSCSDYSTPDLVNAFKDQPCYEKDQLSKVQ